jgi:hypothetical protein
MGLFCLDHLEVPHAEEHDSRQQGNRRITMFMRFERVSVALVLVFAFMSLAASAMWASNPVPLINQPLVPDAVVPGGPAFTLTVNGTGFVSSSVVKWNGSARTTTFVSDSQVKAAITAADTATAGTASVTVVNPTPGGATSNVACLSITTPSPSVGFLLASSPATGSDPYSVAVGDFNGDGKLDLAVANENNGHAEDSTVSILLGDGTGNFSLVSSPTVGSEPESVAVGDFNGDGKLDLAVANFHSNTVSILLGDGTGNFTLASSPATGGYPESVAVGDFNGDGKLDLAVANGGSNTLSILLGDGAGNFTLASSPAAGNSPISVAVGDFNGDGKLDLVVANNGSDTVSVLLGDGTGNFTLASSPATGTAPWSVAVGDFNGDGKLDLAVANACGDSTCNGNPKGTLTILLGDGTGNFTLASSPTTDVFPISVAVGDFNGDGKLDLAVSDDGSRTVLIFLGDGTGKFTRAGSYATGNNAFQTVVGDFNGDGRADVAVANLGSDTVSAFVQSSVVTFTPSNLTFTNQKVGTTSAPQPTTLMNGYAAINISSITIGGEDLLDFSETNTCPSNLPAESSCTIGVKFTPITGGTRTANVLVSDSGAGSPQRISLTGTGLGVELSATKLSFGNLMVGKISKPQIVTLTNIGSTTLTINRITIAGTDKGDFSVSNTCHGSVGPGGTCNIIVRFIPTQMGMRTAKVNISDNGGGSPQKIKLSGNGT